MTIASLFPRGFKATAALCLVPALFVLSAAAAANYTPKTDCYTCFDAGVVPCKEHVVSKEWCEENFFFCSECIEKRPCCRGRGLTPCRCVDRDWDNIVEDWGYEQFEGHIDAQSGLVEAMGVDPMYAVSEHFLLMSTMEGVKFSPGDVHEMADEFKELRTAFPWIFRNAQQLSPHAMLHLYILRLEKIYAEYCKAIGMTVEEDRGVHYSGGVTEVFLVGPVKHASAWRARNNGAALVSGASGRFVLSQKGSPAGGRHKKAYGPTLSGDKNFYDGVIHLTGRCLLERYFNAGGGKNPPGWLKVGFPHYLEWEMLEQCSYYLTNIEIKGLAQDWIIHGWDKRAVSESRRSNCITFPVLSKKDFADLGYKEHLLSWSYVSFLVKKEAREKLRKYWDNLRRRMRPRDALLNAYDWSELTLEHKWRKSLLGGGEEEEMTREERFVFEFDRSRSHPDLETRASAAYYLQYCDNLEAAERVIQAFTEDNVLVRASALEALKKFKNREAALYVIEKGLTHASEMARRNSAIAMGSFPEMADVSIPLLLKLLDDHKAGVRAGAVRALGELHPEEAYLPLAARADDRDPEVRVETALALWNYERDDALTQLIKLLRDPIWAVRLGAIRAMHKVDDRRMIPSLITQLGREGGRLREDIHDLLVKKTHQDFFLNQERWQWWWDNYGDSFEFKPGKVKNTQKMRYAVQYHDVETCSKKFVFLLDVSSSMNDVIDVERIAGKTYNKGDLRKKKIKVAQMEIVRLLRAFDRNIMFNIITFHTEVESWKKSIVTATKGTVKKAEKYIWEIKIPNKSATNIYDTLMTAFDTVDAGFQKQKYESVMDTMFLLSDGNPTAGPVTDVDMILRTIKERNRIHGVKIHTFALGGAADTHFLKKLADITGGQYQVIRVR